MRLGVRDAAQVRTAYNEILTRATAYAPNATISGVLVQEMVTEGVEVIVGVSYDAQLGPTILFAVVGSWSKSIMTSPGVAVPLPRRRRARCCPMSWGRVLHGFRGRSAADIEALTVPPGPRLPSGRAARWTSGRTGHQSLASPPSRTR